MEKSNHNLDIIDLAKFILSIFIMTIHIKTGLPTVVHDFISNGIARVAVPFFFIASGYLYFKKKDSLTNKSILKTLKRIFLFFLGWTIIYGIYFFFKQYINVENPLVREWMFLRRHIFLNPYGHLWFLPALMIGLTLSYIFYKLHLRITSYITAILLYIIGVFGDTYYYLAIKNDYIKSFFDVYLHYFTNFRNGLFFGFAFVCLHSIFSNFSKKNILILTIISVVLLILEYYFVKTNHWAKDHNMYFSLLILVPSLFQLLLKIPFQLSRDTALFFRQYSMGIYFLHPLVSMMTGFNLGLFRFPIILLLCIFLIFIIKKLKIPILDFLLK